MNRLRGKTCVVTAAGQGIGKAIVEAFLAEGAIVVAVDRQHDLLSALGSPPQLTTYGLDVTDDAAVAELGQKVKSVDALVNCVGYVASGSALDDGLSALDASYAINVRALIAMTVAFLPQMVARRYGSIVNIASVVSSVKAAPNRFAYATTKAAVIGLTKSIAIDFIRSGIRCNAISPGTIDTPSLKERMAATGDAAKAYDAFVARQPMGRLGLPQEVAAAAVLLASDETTFMTGENIIIDGGMSL